MEQNLQGDEDPPNKKHDVLPAASKAKALYRRGQVHCEISSRTGGFNPTPLPPTTLRLPSALFTVVGRLRCLVRFFSGAHSSADRATLKGPFSAVSNDGR